MGQCGTKEPQVEESEKHQDDLSTLSGSVHPLPVLILDGCIREFQMVELEVATDDYSSENYLGEGSFGRVYKGVGQVKEKDIEDEKVELKHIAMKKLGNSGFQGFEEFMTEVSIMDLLSKKHPNLVKLLGYHRKKGHVALIYEYMAGGSLDQVLHFQNHKKDDKVKGRRELTWEERVKIGLHAARGLLFLHRKHIIHRDIKSQNILLDEELNAKLSDFGLATYLGDAVTHVTTRVLGTLGYLDPTYIETGHLTSKSDVYSFGVVLLELITGRPPVNAQGIPLTADMEDLINREKGQNLDLDKIMDPALKGRYNVKAAIKLILITAACVNDDGFERPAMEDVARYMEELATVTGPK
eukprot:TRINITY_DN3411_c0_g1_i1.p1 TRINITY_DN3411_c0_g1~~TRINITY_DN3411_c0_g1_i1.p1  ORF type:complete len:355 (-),score=73.24 TRINITY_DN3411_c0_g1_i1:140-1204(-)